MYNNDHINQYPNHNNNPYPNTQQPMGSGQNIVINLPMGVAPTNSLYNNNFLYSGNAVGLQTRLESLTPQEKSSIREATIHCTGNQITELDVCCFACTICWGACFIFPLCFMCCDWWRRKTLPSFQVPQSTYRALQHVVSGTGIQNLTLTVIDNKFNSQKSQILQEILSRSQLRGFTFVNQALDYDFQNKEYTNFVENMRPIKMLPISSQIRWGRILVV